MCASFNLQLANITGPILLNLNEVFGTCSAGLAIFSEYNGYHPLCGAAGADNIFMNDLSNDLCTNFTNATWAICHSGLPIETTITIPTDLMTSMVPRFAIRTQTRSVTSTLGTTTSVTTTETFYLTTFTFTNLHTRTVTSRKIRR